MVVRMVIIPAEIHRRDIQCSDEAVPAGFKILIPGWPAWTERPEQRSCGDKRAAGSLTARAEPAVIANGPG